MKTTILIIIGILIIAALAVIFRKHLKKIGIGIGIIIAGWFGVENVADAPELPTDDEIETPVDSFPETPNDTVVIPEIPVDTTESDTPEIPETTKDTIGEVFEIKLSETGDQTIALQKQIDAIPDGSPNNWNIIEFPKGKYHTEGVDISLKNKGIINFTDRHYLIIKGGHFYTKRPGLDRIGNISKSLYSHRRHIWIENSSHLKFIGTNIEGSNKVDGSLVGKDKINTPEWWVYGGDGGALKGFPAYKSYLEFEHAFQTENSTYITFENVEVNGVFGDGICIGGGSGSGSHHIKIIGGNLTNIGRQGIAVYNATNVLIDGITGTKLRRAWIDLEPYSSSGFANNITIKNTVSDAMQVTIAAMGKGQVNNIVIKNNTYAGGAFIICRDSGEETRRKNWIVTGNKRTNVFGSPSAPVKFYMTDNVVIENNEDHVADSQSQLAAYFSDSKNIEFTDNRVINGLYVMAQKDSEVLVENNKPQLKIKQ